MKTILNKTPRPIKVPLPLGKVLHLGPHKTGEINPKAVDHPPLKKLLDAGDLEIQGDGESHAKRAGASGSVHAHTHGHHQGSTSRQAGDR